MSDDRSAIEFRNVSKVFEAKGGPIAALDDVSLSVQEREFVAIIGPSGCGKTTLLRLAAGLTSPTGGEVLVSGRIVTTPPRNVGLMFQSPVLLPWRSVMRNVLLSVEFLGKDPRKFHDKAEELLELADLHEFRDTYPHELSGGMQQRVALVRMLLYDPDVLLLDEPFGALDALTREELNVALEGIWEQKRKTALLITHSVSEAIFLADRIILISRRPGRVHEIHDVHLPRPRERRMKYLTEFRELEEHISEELMRQVR